MKTNLIKTELTLALKTPNLMDYEPSMIDTLTVTFYIFKD